MRRAALALAVVAVAAMTMAAGAQAYNPATQSHRGACSQSTVNVRHAVRDMRANGVLAQYAEMIGVHWKKGHLVRAMRRALVVGTVKKAVTTANHGCNGHGLIFSVGSRRLHSGETVGVRLPKKYRGRACSGSHAGCKRIVVKRAVVFPTNCWNVNFGHVRVVIYVKPRVVVPKVAAPSATASLKCTVSGTYPTGGGSVSVTMSNGSTATASASFTVTLSGNKTGGSGPTTYGPLSAGQSTTKTSTVDSSGTNVTVTVTSDGKTILSTVFPGGCPLLAT